MTEIPPLYEALRGCPGIAIFSPANSGTSGSNFNTPEADESSKYSMYGCLSRCI